MVAGNEDDPDACLGKAEDRPDQQVEQIPWNVVLVEEISAVDEKLSPDLQGVLSDQLKVPENRIRPVHSTSGVALSCPRDLESEMGVCSVDEPQLTRLLPRCSNPSPHTAHFRMGSSIHPGDNIACRSELLLTITF